MSAKNNLISVSKWRFFVGLGEGIGSGILAGLFMWYISEHENLSTFAGNVLLLLVIIIFVLFPAVNLARRKWLLAVANIAGILLLGILGMVYMVFVLLIISRGEMP